tara:strand:+ start:177 stop:413 length:237 start_codon:yes stop_codon:yes gene_type:complete
MPGKHTYKYMAEGGKADMSARPNATKTETDRVKMPTPMVDAMELSNVEPLGVKQYPNTRKMKYGGSIMYNNGPRKVRS